MKFKEMLAQGLLSGDSVPEGLEYRPKHWANCTVCMTSIMSGKPSEMVRTNWYKVYSLCNVWPAPCCSEECLSVLNECELADFKEGVFGPVPEAVEQVVEG